MEKGTSKLGRKKSKKVGASSRTRSMKSCESLISTPVRSRQDESSADDSICEESSYTYLSSQAVIPEKEVYWDYDTPQIRKYRSKMGIGVKFGDEDGSPIQPLKLEKVSTPEVKLHCKSRPCEVPRETAEAVAAFNDLVELASKLRKREVNKKEEKNKTSTPVIRPVRLNPVETETSARSELNHESFEFSDDDSLLVRCTQDAEGIIPLPVTPLRSTLKNNRKENLLIKCELDFESDDSMEFMMSQIDEKELVARIPPTSREQEPDSKRPLEPINSNAMTSPSSSRSIKRFKSSDDGISPKTSSSLRRVLSSPVIPKETAAARRQCTLAEIERKKHEAKRKRELSQHKKKF